MQEKTQKTAIPAQAGIHCNKKRSRGFPPVREWRAMVFLYETKINQRFLKAVIEAELQAATGLG